MISNQKVRQWAKSVEPGAKENEEYLKKTQESAIIEAKRLEEDRKNRRCDAELDYQKRLRDERESLIQHMKGRYEPDLSGIYLVPKQ